MRYAIVTETYPPEVNGVALTVHGFEQGLRARGHAIDLVRPRQHDDAGGDTREGDDAMLVRGARLPRYPGLQFGLPARHRLLAHWRAQRPDAVYIATEGPLGWSALAAARRLRIPVASGFHTRFDHYMRDYGARWLEPVALAWMRRFHNRGDATLVPTGELADDLRAHGFAQVRRLPRGIDLDRFHPVLREAGLRTAWGVGETGLAVIHVGRIAAEKNLALAVRAFRQLQVVRPDARFVWVGDGPERARLQDANPDFVFAGVQRGEALAAHFASADLFLFPSLSETFGNVTLEAMASGLPIVAYDYGAAREHLRDAAPDAVVAPGDEAGFIAAALRLAADGEARAAIARALRPAVAPLQPGQVVADLDALLQSLVEGRRDEPQSVAQAPRA